MLQDVQMANKHGQAAMSQALSSHKDTAEILFAHMAAVQQDYQAMMERVEASIVARQRILENANQGNNVSSNKASSRAEASNRVDQFGALRMRFLRRQKCDAWCSCKCHKHVRKQTPDILQSILGRLFVGYVGLPALTPSCFVNKCQRRSDGLLEINYLFPLWFLARIMSISLAFQHSRVSKVSLRMLNVRNTNETSF